MCRWRCEYPDPFIVMWEIPEDQRRDEATRMFIVFNGVQEYLRSKYRTCHEVFISSTLDRNEDVIGHPVFDIDAPLGMELGWEKKLEKDIEEVIRAIHPKKEFDLSFVWMVSPNEKKTSRHIVVHGITFLQWRYSSTILYRELKKRCQHIDDGILRACGSLRLPLNSKVGGNSLYFQGNNEFEDGLVMIHDINRHTIGTILAPNDIDPSFLTIKDIMGKEMVVDEVDDSLCSKAFELLDKTFNTGLEMRYGADYIQLQRVRPGTCPISGRVHDNVGAYMFMRHNKVFYGCHRGCAIRHSGSTKKAIDITPPALSMAEKIAMEMTNDEK